MIDKEHGKIGTDLFSKKTKKLSQVTVKQFIVFSMNDSL